MQADEQCRYGVQRVMFQEETRIEFLCESQTVMSFGITKNSFSVT